MILAASLRILPDSAPRKPDNTCNKYRTPSDASEGHLQGATGDKLRQTGRFCRGAEIHGALFAVWVSILSTLSKAFALTIKKTALQPKIRTSRN